jgi:hypothetical protein
MLHISSCLLATVVVHAFYCQAVVYHHAFLLLTISSILFHLTHTDAIRVVDKAIAHATFGLVMLDTRKALAADAAWLLCYPFGVCLAWFGQSVLPLLRQELHLGVHLVGVVGMHAYLTVLY